MPTAMDEWLSVAEAARVLNWPRDHVEQEAKRGSSYRCKDWSQGPEVSRAWLVAQRYLSEERDSPQQSVEERTR